MGQMEPARGRGRAQTDAVDLLKTAERNQLDVYEAVSSLILQRIESGIVPW